MFVQYAHAFFSQYGTLGHSKKRLIVVNNYISLLRIKLELTRHSPRLAYVTLQCLCSRQLPKFIYYCKLNLQTVVFRPLRTRQCSSERIFRLKIESLSTRRPCCYGGLPEVKCQQMSRTGTRHAVVVIVTQADKPLFTSVLICQNRGVVLKRKGFKHRTNRQ